MNAHRRGLDPEWRYVRSEGLVSLAVRRCTLRYSKINNHLYTAVGSVSNRTGISPVS